MSNKSRSILFLALIVLLMVVVSSRVAPRTDGQPVDPTVTDDPFPDETEPPETTIYVSPTPTPPNIRELLPGVSKKDWNLQLVNNTYVLASTFAPNVTSVGDGQYFHEDAADALKTMIDAAKEEGYTVHLRTAYRPFATQAYLFNGKASQIQWGTTMSLLDAETEARKVVAYPGTSEHQLGLAVDIMDNANTSMTVEVAEGLPLLQWLQEHCAEYGFILRYPKDKQDITGWYEPWHFRYVGEECAKYIMDEGLCLEEFIALF